MSFFMLRMVCMALFTSVFAVEIFFAEALASSEAALVSAALSFWSSAVAELASSFSLRTVSRAISDAARVSLRRVTSSTALEEIFRSVRRSSMS